MTDPAASLDHYFTQVKKAILNHQNPVTGLLPASADVRTDAWVRDNVYSILSVWGLSLAYRKRAETDEDKAKAYELEQSVVKLMRGLLFCMMRQIEKVENFKKSQSRADALHAKYNIATGATCVGDEGWGHLQIDATSLYLLTLAQMTASGLQIVFTLDEVSFVQNLVFYIESAYRTPDYGIWERGDKSNNGLPELNASSVGMAKAALEAIDEMDLFGCRGGAESVIHVLTDEKQHCDTILHSLLPRESTSKEVDSSLLSVISFPAFACSDPELVEKTRNKIQMELEGKYGCKRFLRDGYRTAKEDPNRLYYEPAELKIFENIECEWPVFFTYFILDGLFTGRHEQVEEYREKLNEIVLRDETGSVQIPELYYVSSGKVDLESQNPHSQERMPGGKLPHMWAQSLYFIGCLLYDRLIDPPELDPLNRHHFVAKKIDLVIQIALVAEDELIKEELNFHGIESQTVDELRPINVHPARHLSKAYTRLGKNSKLKLSGRPFLDIGYLGTSKLYSHRKKIFAFHPQFMDHEQFYLSWDVDMLVDFIQSNLAYLKRSWNLNGRPTMTLEVTRYLLGEQGHKTSMHKLLQKLNSGYSMGARVKIGKLQDFLKTSCITKLSFMRGYPVIEESAGRTVQRSLSVESSASWDRESASGTALLSPLLQKKKSKAGSTDDDQVQLRTKSFTGSVLRSRKTASIFGDDFLDPALVSSEDLLVSPSPRMDRRRGSITPRKKVLPAPPLLMPTPPTTMARPASCPYLVGTDLTELTDQLKNSSDLQEQADLLHCLFMQKGLGFVCMLDEGKGYTVEELLEEVYARSAELRVWTLVRHTAGMLGKQVEDLASAATDILVRQKQFTFGLPPATKEVTIDRPMPPEKLKALIYKTYGEDVSTAVLTQEVLMYLAMFIRTEPSLFNEMLRLRISLIIRVMAAELGRTVNCSAGEASNQLMNLRPYEVKRLLYHIISGEEFRVDDGATAVQIVKESPSSLARRKISIKAVKRRDTAGIIQLGQDVRGKGSSMDAPEIENRFSNLHGQWIRRRRLDGALNRVPLGFYSKVWRILEKCRGLSVEKHVLWSYPTIEEMTPGELKFALHVETWLNRLPHPEYRQLMVECLMVLAIVVRQDPGQRLGDILIIDSLVYEANSLFLEDLANSLKDRSVLTSSNGGISEDFYDSAPSGTYGTMNYLTQAVVNRIKGLPRVGPSVECKVN